MNRDVCLNKFKDDYNIVLLPYLNGSYKEDVAEYVSTLYGLYENICGKKLFIDILSNYNKRNTSLIRLFIKDLADVIINGNKHNFMNYAMFISNEIPSISNNVITIDINKYTTIANTQPNEFTNILKVVGLEQMVYILFTILKIKRKDSLI